MRTAGILFSCLVLGAGSYFLLVSGSEPEPEAEADTEKTTEEHVSKPRKLNRLSKEKSPYLLQHATNPVDWYPWGEEAFNKAKAENKPIFLSIGYSSCHWCHVMEHESFSDETVAAYLNEHFVAIKVDREERPDVDDVYMTAVTTMTRGGGGWPLSAWLTPDRKPFYGGTYFPPHDMPGRPAFMTMLKRIQEAWSDPKTRQEIEKTGDKIVEHLNMVRDIEDPSPITAKALEHTCEMIESHVDTVYGGFGSQPKFPSPGTVETLLRWALRDNKKRPLEIVELTLDKMARGGIHDHVGGGFHRYSTTRDWLIPHFEKMLYDNAQLLGLYSWAYLVTGKEQYAATARDIARWVLKEMTNERGTFYSAQDADDPGGPEGEGGFYVWDPEEIDRLFPEKEAKLIKRWFDITKDGNWPEKRGKSLLQLKYDLEDTAKLLEIEPDEARRILARAREKMYEVREKRPKPMTDTKVLTAWNGLMISGFCRAYQSLGDKEYLEAAQRAGEFILSDLTDDRGRLYRRWREGHAAFGGVLPDYAYMVAAYLDLYESDFDEKWLAEALRLSKVTVEHFYDPEKGAFFFTADDGEKLLVRSKNGYDSARPSGNGVMASNLLRITDLTGDLEMRAKADKTLDFFGGRLSYYTLGFGAILSAFDYRLQGGREIFIAGARDAEGTRRLVEAVWRDPDPNRVLALVTPRTEQLLPPAKGKTPVDGKPAAYVCRDFTCKAPVTDPAELRPATIGR
jgi:hypothetical protein